MFRSPAVLLCLVSSTAFAQPTRSVPTSSTAASVASSRSTWKIDATHSELSFTIRHLLSRVRGQFDVWGGTIVADPADWSTASVEVTARAASINTSNERRDADLRGADHFDAEANPLITFRSVSVTRLPNDSVSVAGNLTMRGVTKPVVLRGHFTGMTGVPGKRRAGFEASTVIDRRDFNMIWNRVVEGGSLLGNEVKVDIDIAAVEQSG